MDNSSETISLSFDAEAVLAAFLADEQRTSLELPHMTTGQRKHARKFAEQHPELTCESFGFGAERQLHIFKKSHRCATRLDKAVNKAKAARGEEQAARAVTVKNTFIDDWVNQEDADGPAEPVVFRSMPPQLPQNMLQSTHGKLDLSPIIERPCVLLEQHLRPPSPGSMADCSTAASGSSTANGSPVSSNRELPQATPLELPVAPPPGLMLPPGLEVRNTFIHDKGAHAENIPTRAVQSMPHGMFGQLLQEEFFKRAVAWEISPMVASLPDVAHEPAADATLAPGTEVTIDGLQKLPAFNGLSGSVQSYDEESGRYSILLTSSVGGHKWAKVKRDNLLLVVPPLPPAFSPTVSSDDVAEMKQPLRLAGLV